MRVRIRPPGAVRVARPRRTKGFSPPNIASAMMDAAGEKVQAGDRESSSPAPSSCPFLKRAFGRAHRRAESVGCQASVRAAGHATRAHIPDEEARRRRLAHAPDSTIPWARSRPCSRRRIRPTTRPSIRAADPPTHRRMGCRFREPSFLEPDLQSECARLMITGGLASLQVAGHQRRPGMREHPRAGDQGLPPAIDGVLQRA
jgi:hypothetical protein